MLGPSGQPLGRAMRGKPSHTPDPVARKVQPIGVAVVEGRRRLVLSAEAAAAVSASFQGQSVTSEFLTPEVMRLLSQDVTLEEVPDMETETTCAREEDVDLLPPAADFTFAELFAGIGGFRLGLEALGGRCVFACEIHGAAREVYSRNFAGELHGDLRSSKVPAHDLLVAGFPCQPFSALGNQPGLQAPQGQLFGEIVRVLRQCQPEAFLLENVPGLLHSNRGADMSAILAELRGAGYHVFHDVVNARSLTAQQRKRLFLVGFRGAGGAGGGSGFQFPEPAELGLLAKDVLDGDEELGEAVELYTISDQQLERLRTRSRMSRSLAWGDRKLETLISHYSVSVWKGLSQLVPRVSPSNPRLFTGRECARIMGFPNRFDLAKDRQMYPLFGNAVCPPVVAHLGAAILQRLGLAATEKTAQAVALQATRAEAETKAAQLAREMIDEQGVPESETATGPCPRSRPTWEEVALPRQRFVAPGAMKRGGFSVAPQQRRPPGLCGHDLTGRQFQRRRSCTELADPAAFSGSNLGAVLRGFARRLLAFLSMFAWWSSVPTKPTVAARANVIDVTEVKAKETAASVAAVAAVASQEDPVVPGMDAANLVVRLDSEPGVAGTELAEEKMRQTNQQVLQDLCGEGWSVRPIDAANGVFELTLPAVRYSMPMGVVSIPAPLFRAQVRDSDKTVGNYQERLIADIVLQNGDKMLGVELGFPFSSKFTISAAGWARCRVGREPGSVRCQALVEMGLQVPKVPGLTSILQFFVKSYANKSAHDCAVSLSKEAAYVA
ncbi:unnamed protein product, partial [Effrenium voratum]